MSSSRIVKILFKKEIKDIFRDKKSVLMMFFVPVVLYPLIFFVAFTVISVIQMVGVQNYTVVIDGDDGKKLENKLEESITDESNYTISVIDKNDFELILKDSELSYSDQSDAIEKALDEEYIDAYVTVKKDISYDVCYNSSVTNSLNTYDLVDKGIDEISLDITKNLIINSGLDPDEILEPVEKASRDTATTEESFGYFLGTIIPFMMIISLLVSVFTPAIDVTTGEKERGTLETLLMMPVTNTQIIVSKFLAVALIGVISTGLSILSMTGLGIYMLNMIDESMDVSLGGMNMSTFVPAILVAIPVLIVLSLFLTAISMCVSCIAKTYKEANTYMSPVMIVIMLTGYIGFIPNIEFNTTMAAIPVVNVCLLIKNILLFKVDIALVFVVLVSTVAYTGLILVLLGKLYHSEAILFDEDRSSIKLFEKRSNIIPGPNPSMGDAYFVIFLDMLLLIYAGGMLQVKYGLFGVFLSQLVLVSIPVFMAIYTKRYKKDTFSLSIPDASGRLRAISGGLFTGVGAILIGQMAGVVMTGIFPDMGKALSDTIGSLLDGNKFFVWFVIALTPAICEELLFRGYLLSAAKERLGVLSSSVLIGVIFGIYHMDIIRFPSTAILGTASAYITIRTGSIYVGMFMHMLNNSLAVFAYLYPEWAEKYLGFLVSDDMSVGTVVILAAAGIFLCFIGVMLLKPKKTLDKSA